MARVNLKNKFYILPLLFALIGIIILVKSLAATPYASIEPENGTILGNAAVVTDSTASGGKYLQFNTGAGGLWRRPEKKASTWWQTNLHFNWLEQNVVNQTGNINLADVHILEVAPKSQSIEVPGFGIYTIPQGKNPGFIADAHAKGIGVICYMDTGAYETDWPDRIYLSQYSSGVSTTWSGEYWLNVDTQAQWGPIIMARIKYAASIGCDGIEGDQNDGAQNGVGTLSNEVTWYKAVANAIHGNGMGWAIQKNGYFDDAGSILATLEPYYDGILIEQPFEYKDNIDKVKSSYVAANKPVFAVDYTAANSHPYFNNTTLAAICDWDKQQGFEGYIFHDDPDGTYRYECGP